LFTITLNQYFLYCYKEVTMYEWKNKSDESIAKLCVDQLGRAKERRGVYDDLHSLIVKIFRPRRYDILGNSQKGQQYGSTLYDQHPANALNKSLSGLIGYMVSRSSPWLQFIAPDVRLMQLDHIKRYCQEATEQVLYGANRSNIYASLIPHGLDAYSVGTSVMIPNSDEVKDRVVFDVVHPRDSYIICNRFGDPIIYFRELKLTRLTALEYFTEDKLPTTWFKKDANGNSELKDQMTEQKFVWATYPNADRDTSSLLPVDREFAVFAVMLGSAGPDKSSLVMRSGREVFPVCWRQLRESGSDYGTSLAADCLTSALVCNKLTEKSVAAAHQAVEPAGIWSKSLRGSLMKTGTNPGARIFADDITRDGFKPILDRLNWPVSDAQIERLHSQIDDKFFIKFFEMLSSGDIKARTAYEVSQMMAEKAALMTSIVDTFEQDTLEPSLEAIILHETEAGRMPEPPGELVESGSTVDIRYLGPLAQLQRTLLKAKGTVDAMAIISQIAALDETVAWKFNWLEIAEEVAVNQGMPQKHIKSDEEVAAIVQQQQQQQQAAQQAEMLGNASKAAGPLGKRPESGSPMEKISNMVAE